MPPSFSVPPSPEGGYGASGGNTHAEQLQRDEFSDFDQRDKREGQINNAKFQEDVNYAIELNRKIASFVGIWPLAMRGDPTKVKFKTLLLRRCHNFVLYCFLLFLIVPGILHIVLDERTFKRKMLKTGPMILNTMAVLKYTAMLTREAKIRKCFKLIESDWQDTSLDHFRAMMRRNANLGRRLTRVCAVTWYVGGIFYRFGKTLLTPNRIVNGLVYKALPSPLYSGIFRFNTSASPAHELLFTGQMMASAVVHSTTVTTCTYAAVLGFHACGQFDIVDHLLTKLVDKDGDNGRLTKAQDVAVTRRLRIIVQLHLKVIRFVNMVEDLMSEICLVEIFGGTIILCLTGYYFILDWEKNDAWGILTYFMMIASLMILLFTYCYIGELVNDRAVKVETSSYMIDWYELPPKKGLCIGLIIAIARCPTKLTAGKMLELSMYNFGGIIRSAVGYLNLLRTMTE